MELVSGIAFGALCVLAAPVCIAAIRAKRNGNSNSHCPEHSGICEKLDVLDTWLNKIEAKLDRVIEGQRQ